MKKIVIVAPSYNEEENILAFYNETLKHLNDNYEYNFLFIDDGSKDKTLDLVKSIADDRVKYVSFSKNFGKEAALLAGLRYSLKLKADATVVMDVDLQDPPRLLDEMTKKWEEGYNFVQTKHRDRKNETFLKRFFAMSFYKIYSILTGNKNLSKGARDFSLMDKKVVEAFLRIKDKKRFTKGIANYVGFKKYMIEFDYEKRYAGKTKWSFKGLFRYALVGINQFSEILKIVPKLMIPLFLVDLLHNLKVLNINFLNKYVNTDARITFYGILFLIISISLFKVLYDVKEQTLNRPMYLVEEDNV